MKEQHTIIDECTSFSIGRKLIMRCSNYFQHKSQVVS
jgi:hypothetical protein